VAENVDGFGSVDENVNGFDVAEDVDGFDGVDESDDFDPFDSNDVVDGLIAEYDAEYVVSYLESVARVDVV
jgi:hypothetical protein